MVIVCSRSSIPFTGLPSVDQFLVGTENKNETEFFMYFSPLFLWSVIIVECILWCRLVYVHAQKSDGILCIFVVVCRGCCNIVFNHYCMKSSVSQCVMNMHVPIALCTKCIIMGTFL